VQERERIRREEQDYMRQKCVTLSSALILLVMHISSVCCIVVIILVIKSTSGRVLRAFSQIPRAACFCKVFVICIVMHGSDRVCEKNV